MSRLAIVLGCAGLMVAGCSNPSSRKVLDGYCLYQRLSGEYYDLSSCSGLDALRTVRGGETDNGPLGGTVQRIGWDRQHIVAYRKAIFGSDPDGWMIINTAANALTGPLTDAEWERQRRDNPQLRAITVLAVDEAWATLGRN